MKKFILIFTLILVALVTMATMSKAESLVYSVQVSTQTLGQYGAIATSPCGVTGVVRVKNVVVHQPGTNAQYLYLYKNWTSTTAATLVDTFYVPGTAGNYYPYGDLPISNALGNFDIINMPNFAVRVSSDNCAAVGLRPWITLLYSNK